MTSTQTQTARPLDGTEGRIVEAQRTANSPTRRGVVVEVSASGRAVEVVWLRKDGTPSEQSSWTGTYHSVRLV